MSSEEFNFDINIPFIEEVFWNTLVTPFEDGKEQRRKKWSQPKRAYVVTIRGRSDVITARLWDFYNSRSGSFDTFYFENPNDNPVTNELVGLGNNSTTTFTLDHYPLPSGAITVTVAAVSKTEVTDYTLTRSTGTIVFEAGSIPNTGDEVRATYDYCRKVRFSEESMSREMFNYKLYNSGVKLIEVLE